MKIKKSTILGKARLTFFILIVFSFFNQNILSKDIDLFGDTVELKILDKLNSKNDLLMLKIGQTKRFKNLEIKALKCRNSEFDDNPEIIAYLQVKDLNKKDNDEVFLFNGWTFSSSPTIKPFDHPVYDIWLTKCY